MRKLLLPASMALVACAHAGAPCTASPTTSTGSGDAPTTAPDKPAANVGSANGNAGPLLALLVRPIATPKPLVHIEIELSGANGATGAWHLARGASTRVVNASAHDATGDVGVRVSDANGGVDLTLAGAAGGTLHLGYDVLAGDDAPDDALAVLVLDDRFRGAGETLVALPAAILDTPIPFVLRIDGEPLHALAASSLGVGAVRKTTLAPRSLRYASFIAGSLGAMVIDDPAAGHDEGAWLGYTAFDARPVVAEISQTRTAIRDSLRSHDETPWAYLFVSQTRPIGSFSTSPRSASVLVQVGPAEPWTTPLRLSVAQQIARRWIGGETRVTTQPGHEAEGLWFSEGVGRYFVTRVLSHAGLATPDDVRDVIAGELSVLSTSPLRGKTNAELASMATKDDVARATLMARGALYALAESAAIRGRSKGDHGLEKWLAALVERAEDGKVRTFTTTQWTDAMAKDDPEAGKTFDALVIKGGDIVLPPKALGPCFTAGTGEYVAYDAGFDVDATRASKEARVTGVRADGPAAKAGLRDGDVVVSMTAREGDAAVPVKIVVTRGNAQTTLSYLPKGARGRGQTWTRLRGIADDRCGEIP